MTNDWIIDVLTDLKKFSATNELGRLADHLDDTIMVAANELSSEQSEQLVGSFDQARGHAGPAHSGDSA
ncbi:hypothetical protein [Litoreibacter roseus]|uniref:Uncharacterized protein n=1 Tax=Litoreibacter roseus TaxID=2601869 RepID=A0A6N6JB62_9RHOB|nr:hypothetical protein [Litoreibacter roseus]GFE63294.1 hypothetical protein KIN_03680 [Litoreibacter roseus]